MASTPIDYVPPESVEEIIARYAVGERYFGHADIPDGADFREATLEDAVFELSFLSSADFRGANLKRVSFRSANVKCSDFREADLEGATFEGASVEATDFAGANMSGVSFAGAGYYGYSLREGERPPDCSKSERVK